VSQSDVAHVELDWDDNSIITISDNKEDWHPKAKYWLPLSNADRFEIYLEMNKLSKLECKKHLQRLVAGRIVQRTNTNQSNV